mmetsp:Transcript_39845/g.105391  ORF Transcript_39845/g.105391 Transcript_39845/m.105391 type:complete len:381 (+) Transcript_39845:470-1612(+)
MANLIRAELRVQRELLQVARDQLPDPVHVLRLHLAHALELGGVGDLVELDRPRHGHPGSEVGEAHLDQLLRVQRAVVVAALADRARQDHAGRVDRLPDVLLVDPPGDLLDQHRREALRPKLLVHAKEVDLYHLDGRLVDLDAARDTRDEAHQLHVGLHAHTQVPVAEEARGLERPPEEFHGVVETEHAVVVLDVVLAEQRVDLLRLFVVVDVARAPLEGIGQGVRLIADLIRVLDLVDRPAVLGVLGAHRGHRLRVPEGVRPGSLDVAPGLFADPRAAQDLEQLLLRAQAVAALFLLAVRADQGEGAFCRSLAIRSHWLLRNDLAGLLVRRRRRALGLASLLLLLLLVGLLGPRLDLLAALLLLLLGPLDLLLRRRHRYW